MIDNLPATNDLAMIERMLLNPDFDVAKAKELMNMREHMLDRQARQEFNAAMRAVQEEAPRIINDRFNEQTKSHYATLRAMNDAIIPIYTKHGFSLSFGTADSPAEKHVRITCDVSHIGGDSRPRFYDLPIDDVGIKGAANKTQIHGSGSTLSYGRRYLTMLIFNITTGDDNDGQKVSDLITPEEAETIEKRIKPFGEEYAKKFLAYMKIDSVSEITKATMKKAITAIEAKETTK